MFKKTYLFLLLNSIAFSSYEQISGPTTVCTGTIVTYFQNSAFGADYYWSVTPGTVLTDPWIKNSICDMNGTDSFFECYEDPVNYYIDATFKTPGTYTIKAHFISYDGQYYNNSLIIINVIDQTIGGNITSGSSPIFQGISTGIMILTGQNSTAIVVKWQKRLNGGNWTDITNTINENITSYFEIPDSAGIWDDHAIIQNGSCSPVISGMKSIKVNRLH